MKIDIMWLAIPLSSINCPRRRPHDMLKQWEHNSTEIREYTII